MLYTEHAKTDDERRKGVDRHKVFHRVMEHALGEAGLSSYYKSEENLAEKSLIFWRTGSSLTNQPQPHHSSGTNNNNNNDAENREYQNPLNRLIIRSNR
jgi:hypothetical protein